MTSKLTPGIKRRRTSILIALFVEKNLYNTLYISSNIHSVCSIFWNEFSTFPFIFIPSQQVVFFSLIYPLFEKKPCRHLFTTRHHNKFQPIFVTNLRQGIYVVWAFVRRKMFYPFFIWRSTHTWEWNECVDGIRPMSAKITLTHTRTLIN